MDEVVKVCFGNNNSVFDDAFSVRKKVFVEEQGIPIENEYDDFDSTAYHFVLYVNTTPIACARVNIEHERAKICRIAVISAYRGNGIASRLC